MNDTKRFVRWHKKSGDLSAIHVVDVAQGMITYCGKEVPEACKFINDPELDEIIATR